MMTGMMVFKQMDEWTTPKLTGFTGIDLGNYEVAKELSPVIQQAMVERLDVLCSQVHLSNNQIKVLSEDYGVSYEQDLPEGFVEALRVVSAGPRPPWPVPEPPPEVAARLDKLDEILFSPHGMGLKGRVFMNAVTFADVRKWHRNQFEPISEAALLKMGWMGKLYHPMFDYQGAYKAGMTLETGRQIWLTRLVPPHFLFIDKLETMTPFPRAVAPSDDELIPLQDDCVAKPIPIPQELES